MTDTRHEALKLLWAEINETRRRQAKAEQLEDPVQRAEAMEAQKSRRAVLEWIEGEVRRDERPEDGRQSEIVERAAKMADWLRGTYGFSPAMNAKCVQLLKDMVEEMERLKAGRK